MKGGTASGVSGGMRGFAVHINPPEKSLENPRPAPSRKALLLVRAELRREGLAWCSSPVRARSITGGGGKGSGKGNIIRVGAASAGAGGIEPASHTREVDRRVPGRRILVPVSVSTLVRSLSLP